MGLFSKKTNKNVEQSDEKYVPQFGACIVTKSILNGTSKLKWLFRENNGIGTGWVALGNMDTQEYINKAENLAVVDFAVLAEIEPTVMNIFYMPVGADLEFCCDKSGKYFLDTNTGQEIREVVKHPAQAAFEKNLKFLNKVSYEPDFFKSLFCEAKNIKTIIMGQADFPTGSVALADPLAYLGNPKYQTVLETKIPKGKYDVELSVIRSKLVGVRIAAARLTISHHESIRHELAMPKGFTINDYNKPGVFSVFGVDTGLACFCDESIAEKYADFYHTWQEEHAGQNIYQDYFAQLFQESGKNTPLSGNFLLWNFPASNENIAMLSSGMGDGIYSAYWGFDKNGEITELVVPFMNPEYF